MGKSVLYGSVTFGRNHSYPSTSIAKKVAKMEKFPPVHEHQLHLKTVLFFLELLHSLMWTVWASSIWKFITWQRNFSNTSKYHDSLLPPVIWTWLRVPPNITVSVYSLVKTKERNSLFNQEGFENTHFQFVPHVFNERESFFSLSICCFWSPFFKTA